jgi:hypothetical protein
MTIVILAVLLLGVLIWPRPVWRAIEGTRRLLGERSFHVVYYIVTGAVPFGVLAWLALGMVGVI